MGCHMTSASQAFTSLPHHQPLGLTKSTHNHPAARPFTARRHPSSLASLAVP
ncbi:hypothetical protein BC831DRAFT_441123, partial [Entophlyctis helioformis]